MSDVSRDQMSMTSKCSETMQSNQQAIRSFARKSLAVTILQGITILTAPSCLATLQTLKVGVSGGGIPVSLFEATCFKTFVPQTFLKDPHFQAHDNLSTSCFAAWRESHGFSRCRLSPRLQAHECFVNILCCSTTRVTPSHRKSWSVKRQ